jgi:hypothetical protein
MGNSTTDRFGNYASGYTAIYIVFVMNGTYNLIKVVKFGRITLIVSYIDS